MDSLKKDDLVILDDPHVNVVAILEQIHDIPPLLAIQSRVPTRIRVIATSPAVAWELGKQQVGFRGIEEFCDREAMVALGMDNFRTVQEICDLIDADLGEHIPSLEEFNIRPAGDNFLFFKILYDGLSIRSSILQGLAGRENPDLLLTFRWNTEGQIPSGSPHVPFPRDEHLYGTVLSCPGWSSPVTPVVLRYPVPRETGRTGIFEGIGDSLEKHSNLYNLAYTRKRYGTRRSLRLLPDMAKNWFNGGERLLITGYAYNWHYLIPELYAHGFQVTHLHIPPAEMASSGKEVTFDRALVASRCRLNGIDLSGVFFGRAIPALSRAVHESRTLASPISRRLDALNPVAVLCGARARSLDHLPARIARDRGIPVLSWQHGSQGVNHAPIMLYTDVMGSDYHLCFGEGVRDEFAADAMSIFLCDVRSVGSYELQELVMAVPEKDPEFSVLYATTSYYGNYLYVSAPSLFRDLEFWETQRAILDLLGRSGKKAAFKLHPSTPREENLYEFLDTQGYRNITPFKTERTFLDLLRCSEMVVLDFPSTALLQSIAAGKPVFVLTKHLKLTNRALSLLAKRAWCADDLPRFLAMLQGYLDGTPRGPVPDIRNIEFLERYGVHRLDGNVAGRAMEVLGEARRGLSGPPGHREN